VKRLTKVVRRGEKGLVEVAIDQGRVTTPRGSVPICEIELELKDGEPDALFDLALALNKETPLRLETSSKSDRGYALLTEDAIGWSKAPALVLDPVVTGAQAFSSIVRHNLAHLLSNERAAREGHDPEGVHQARVAIRKLRSVLTLFRSFLPVEVVERHTEELRWLAGEMGTARDLDVFLDELLAPVQAACPGDTDLAVLENPCAGGSKRGL
jgi:inorganic triphosphatase YgiF